MPAHVFIFLGWGQDSYFLHITFFIVNLQSGEVYPQTSMPFAPTFEQSLPPPLALAQGLVLFFV